MLDLSNDFIRAMVKTPFKGIVKGQNGVLNQGLLGLFVQIWLQAVLVIAQREFPKIRPK